MEELQFATELPTYSDKKVSKILSHLKIEKIQRQSMSTQHFIKLVSIEECFKKSQTFSFEKGTELFHKHLEELKKEGLNLHENLREWSWSPTPLGFAAQQRSPVLVNALLQAKADVNYSTMKGDKSTNSPLHLLCMEIIHFSQRKELPLSSIHNYQTECTEILIRSKANLESLDEENHLLDTPLFLATRNGYDNVVKLLVNAKANLYLDIINTNVNPLAHHFPTPLHVITESKIEIEKSLLVTKMLVNVGIDFFAVNLFKQTSADEARSSKKPAVFCYLNNLMVDFMSETKAVLNQIGFRQALAPIVFDYLLNPQYSSHEEIKYRCYTRYRYQVESTSDAKQIPIEKRLTKL